MKLPTINRTVLTLICGFILWLGFASLQWPFSPFQLTYVEILILAAPLWLIPLVWQITAIPSWAKRWALPASTSLAIAFVMPIGKQAALLSIPWLILTLLLAVEQLYQHYLHKKTSLSSICQLMAFLYLPVGAMWAFANRIDFHPLGFAPTIGLLTVAHFHYAGFALPIMTGFILQHINSAISRTFARGVIIGVPLVAIGITTTHLQWPVFIEVFAVSIMSISAAGIGFLHLKLAWKYRGYFYAYCWCLGGIALMGGMVLAFLYGWRHFFPIPALQIPMMYAIHGSLNALGFALPGLVGWVFYQKKWGQRAEPLW